MSITAIRGQQILNGTVQRADMNTATSGQAVITKIIGGTGITLSSTGMDSGTGDVTVSSSSASVIFVSKTAAYTLTTSDSGNYFICSGGSWTLTLPAPASGLNYRVRNDMGITGTTGTITLSPTGGTIEGLASLALLPGQDCTLFTDGTNWRALGRQREVVLGTIDTTVATASVTVLLPTGYRCFELEFTALQCSADAQYLDAQLSTNGGSTFITAANYSDQFVYNSGASTLTTGADVNLTFWALASIGNTLGGQSKVMIYPGSAATRPSFISESSAYITSATSIQRAMASGHLAQNVLINALKYYFSSGNITNSFLTVKGIV